MAPHMPRPGFVVPTLRCRCAGRSPLGPGALSPASNSHSVDIAREGYVNLLRAATRRLAEGGDSLEQLHHRAQFLGPYFAAVAPTIVAGLRQAGAELVLRGLGRRCWCGTGHHLAAVAVSRRRRAGYPGRRPRPRHRAGAPCRAPLGRARPGRCRSMGGVAGSRRGGRPGALHLRAEEFRRNRTRCGPAAGLRSSTRTPATLPSSGSASADAAGTTQGPRLPRSGGAPSAGRASSCA